MPVTIRVHLAEKRSSRSQYENVTYGADIEASGLELHDPEEIRAKAHELFVLARAAIQAQLLEPLPSEPRSPPRRLPTEHSRNGPSASDRSDRSRTSDGNDRRRFTRPDPEPTPKQKRFLKQIADERGLDPESVGELCERVIGVPLRSANREDLSRLIDLLLEDAA